MTAVAPPETSARPLVLSPKVRSLTWNGRQYAYASTVPLVYLAASSTAWSMMQRFASPTRVSDAIPSASAADTAFLRELLTTGVLLDAERPDPIHALGPISDQARSFMLYPTSSCNLRCVYCYATSGPGSGPRLSLEHALSAVDGFFAELPDNIRLVTLGFHGGGEPTTNFAVMEGAWRRFREHASERGISATVSTITNGTFGPAVLRTLSQPEWSVNVSYDGPRQAEQRPNPLGMDSRDRVVANLRALRSAGKVISTRATLTRDGLPYFRALVEDAADVGISAVQVEPASLVGRGANLLDGPPDAMEFAEAFLDAFRYGLELGVQVSTAAMSHGRVGDGRHCGAISGLTAVTPDGFVSCCVEATDGGDPEDPFIIGNLEPATGLLQIWPVRRDRIQARIGYDLPHCSTCYMVDTCAGGCPSRARARHGSAFVREEFNCVISRRINGELIADIADGRLVPDAGWQDRMAQIHSGDSSVPDATARVVALVPPFARRAWNADPRRRPVFVPSQSTWFRSASC